MNVPTRCCLPGVRYVGLALLTPRCAQNDRNSIADLRLQLECIAEIFKDDAVVHLVRQHSGLAPAVLLHTDVIAQAELK
jgi:hypothetical protein